MRQAIKVEGNSLIDGFMLMIALEMDLHCSPVAAGSVIKGLAIWHHFEFNYILNLYDLSMCFVRYHNWVVCTMYNAVRMLFFILRKFLGKFRHSLCAPGTYTALPGSLWILLSLTDLKQLVCCQKSAAVIEVITVDWAGVILVSLSCKVLYLN
jgi:hypothetical protein